ncbi:MAG: hypothetical protein CM15mP40_06470 [Alphaproteobacteria bacterium]|nr:MAG: hypothetical protein CM15mP40_06470 [Alphaproteobacteria bacterium]
MFSGAYVEESSNPFETTLPALSGAESVLLLSITINL